MDNKGKTTEVDINKFEFLQKEIEKNINESAAKSSQTSSNAPEVLDTTPVEDSSGAESSIQTPSESSTTQGSNIGSGESSYGQGSESSVDDEQSEDMSDGMGEESEEGEEGGSEGESSEESGSSEKKEKKEEKKDEEKKEEKKDGEEDNPEQNPENLPKEGENGPSDNPEGKENPEANPNENPEGNQNGEQNGLEKNQQNPNEQANPNEQPPQGEQPQNNQGQNPPQKQEPNAPQSGDQGGNSAGDSKGGNNTGDAKGGDSGKNAPVAKDKDGKPIQKPDSPKSGGGDKPTGPNGTNAGANSKVNKAKQAAEAAKKAKEKAEETGSAVAGGAAAAKEVAKQQMKEKIAKKVAAKVTQALSKVMTPLLPYIGYAVLILIVLFLIFIIIVAIVSNEDDSDRKPKYNINCSEVTVVSYNGSAGGIYDFEEYIKGVVQNEVGGFSDSPETLKALAVAARTYSLAHLGADCSIENSTRFQTFNPNYGTAAAQAVVDTTGEVMMNSSGGYVSAQYDAFAVYSETSTDYIIRQQDQHIPKSWADRKIGKNAIEYDRNHAHGNGLSQWGAYYLATEEEYSYSDILSYYYGDFEIYQIAELEEGGSTACDENGECNLEEVGTTNVGNYPLNSSGSIVLRNQKLSDFLAEKGSSINVLNRLISNNVDEVGRSTREGVVSSAITLIGELNKYGIRAPYFLSGGQSFDWSFDGAKDYWGAHTTGSKVCTYSGFGRIYDTCGLDCAGFVNWAIYNGGFKPKYWGSDNLIGYGEVRTLDPERAVVRAGDILVGNGHVVLVVGSDDASKTYIVAEAAGYDYGVLFSRYRYGASGYRGVNMDPFYANPANKR